ncbi:MAG: phospholipase D family protein [Paracoccaceae bacterium]|nr:phospholipase D family protein [Paracoccaceae bacterium]
MHPFGPLFLLGLLALTALAAAGLTLGIARLLHPRPRGPHPASHALPPPPESRIAAALAARLAAHPGLNAVQLLGDPVKALAARLALIEAAQSSVDLQYYIWQNDTAGALMLDALRAAASRGLRVRLLLDDNGTSGLDETLAVFAALPNVEVRLFNPFPIRRARVLGYLSDFSRLNRRMHNKAMVVDGSAAILGGRNIADDYFNRFAPGGLYMDLDVAVAGPVVPEVATQFDLYWNSIPAIPAQLLLAPVSPDRVAALTAQEIARLSQPDAVGYVAALRLAGHAPPLLAPDAPLTYAPARLLFDPPEKISGLLQGKKMLWHHLLEALGQPHSELLLISPYLVPTRVGVRALGRFARNGVRTRILTNSFAANDVPLVHSGYAHRRRPLLRRGVELLEYAPDADTTHAPDGPGAFLADFVGSRIKGTSPFSRNKLHAKVFAVDRARVFIGSFNFDPRSMRLNTELGLLIEAPSIAAGISDAFDNYFPARAWRVTLGPTQRLRWSRPGQPDLHHEPGTSLRSRVALGIAQRLPIEWML